MAEHFDSMRTGGAVVTCNCTGADGAPLHGANGLPVHGVAMPRLSLRLTGTADLPSGQSVSLDAEALSDNAPSNRAWGGWVYTFGNYGSGGGALDNAPFVFAYRDRDGDDCHLYATAAVEMAFRTGTAQSITAAFVALELRFVYSLGSFDYYGDPPVIEDVLYYGHAASTIKPLPHTVSHWTKAEAEAVQVDWRDIIVQHPGGTIDPHSQASQYHFDATANLARERPFAGIEPTLPVHSPAGFNFGFYNHYHAIGAWSSYDGGGSFSVDITPALTVADFDLN